MPRRLLPALFAIAAAYAVVLPPPVALAATGFAQLSNASRQERVESQGRRVAPQECSAGKLVFRISRRDGLGAWAWPSGTVEITPDLVDALDDDELAAALAHEVAHLIGDDIKHRKRAALAESDSEAIERTADRLGCSILADAGLPPDAMVRMLSKVATGLRKPGMLAPRIAQASLVCRTLNGATTQR
jgi:Zn-dependent protease with chaperone function